MFSYFPSNVGANPLASGLPIYDTGRITTLSAFEFFCFSCRDARFLRERRGSEDIILEGWAVVMQD